MRSEAGARDERTGRPYHVVTTVLPRFERDKKSGTVAIAVDCMPATFISSICLYKLDTPVDPSGKTPVCLEPSVCVSEPTNVTRDETSSTATILNPKFVSYYNQFHGTFLEMGTLTVVCQGMTREIGSVEYELSADLFNQPGMILPQTTDMTIQPSTSPRAVVGRALVDSMCMLYPPVHNGPTDTPDIDLATLYTLASLAKVYYGHDVHLAEVVSAAMLPFFQMAHIDVHSVFKTDYACFSEPGLRTVFVGLQRVTVPMLGHQDPVTIPVADDVSALSLVQSVFRKINQLARTGTAHVIATHEKSAEPISRGTNAMLVQLLRRRGEKDAAQRYEDAWEEGKTTVESFAVAHRAQVFQLHAELEKAHEMYVPWIQETMPPEVKLSKKELIHLSRFLYDAMTHGLFPATLDDKQICLYMVPLSSVACDPTVHRASFSCEGHPHLITATIMPFRGVPQQMEPVAERDNQLVPLIGSSQTPTRWMSNTCMHTRRQSYKLSPEMLDKVAVLSPEHTIAVVPQKIEVTDRVATIDPYAESTDATTVTLKIDGEKFTVRLV